MKEIIVFDLEWNQPHIYQKKVPGLRGEIIQFGAIKVDKSLNVTDSFSQIVKPNFYRTMNRDIMLLTQITNKDLQSGIPFMQVAEKFKAWCGNNSILISWGTDDAKMLANNMRKYEMDISWIPDSYDAQLMFDDQEMQEDRQWALNYALYHYSEKPDSSLHNALSDAISTAKVLKHLNFTECLEDDYFIYY